MMVQHIKGLGAYTVMSFRLDGNEVGEYMDEIIAYGTAVVIQPGNDTAQE